MTVWDEDSPIRQNWNEDEVDVLTSVGHTMGISLGKWFQKDMIKKFTNNNTNTDTTITISNTNISTTTPKWRCSKSGRGKESGYDFKTGFNSINIIEVW